MLEEKEGLDCRKLESEQSNCLLSKSHEYIQNVSRFSGNCSEMQEKEPTDSENISENRVQRCSERSVMLGNDVFVSPTDSENISEHLRTSPEMEELIVQYKAQERYSQKPDFIITPENQSAHEENLHQLSLIPEFTKADYFYHHVEGITVQELPTEAEEQRMTNFKQDYEILEKLGKVNPFNKVNEGQRVFDIFDHAMWACKHHENKLSLNQILDKYYRDLSDRWLACFFIERAMERGEVQVCSA